MRGRVGRLALGSAAVTLSLAFMLASPSLAGTPPGPPYPAEVGGQTVYDYAGVFLPDAIASAQQTIASIQARTGAQIVVLTQIKPASDSLDKANADALALMNQWGIGGQGTGDGLVILFDLQSNRRHGQASLYAGSGFDASYLTTADRQAIFDKDIAHDLKFDDFDGALADALKDVDKATTPDHANQLRIERLINLGAGVGVLIFAVFLLILVLLNWYKVGRDPVYTTDSSVLLPSPPEGLTPAMATVLISDGASQRTVAAALVDLAAQGLVHFRSDDAGTGSATSIGATGKGQMPETPEGLLCVAIAGFTGPDGFIDSSDEFTTVRLGTAVQSFQADLETLASEKGWLTGNPATVIAQWASLGAVEIVAGLGLGYWTWRLDAIAGLVGAVGLGIVGLATICTAFFMPSRTREGSMLRAMVLAYRQTLVEAMTQSHSMVDVAATPALPWLKTPDMAMAWGIAFGLDSEIDAVMSRAVGTVEAAGAPWCPIWYSTSGRIGIDEVGVGEAALRNLSPDLAMGLGSIGATLGALGLIGPIRVRYAFRGRGFGGTSGGFGGAGGAGGGF
jgi:uncharacterized membrane protein YgcG